MTTKMDSTLDNLMKRITTVSNPFERDNADELLLANAFLEDEEIWDLLYQADQPTYDYVYENMDKYCQRVRAMLKPSIVDPEIRSLFKMSVVELTPEAEERMMANERGKKAKDFDIYWETIKTSFERPPDELDDEIDEAWQALSAARDRMTAYLASKKSKYVPPSARAAGDSVQREIEVDIEECKAAFQDVEKRIEKADAEYLAKKKNEQFEEWLRKVSA